MSWLLMWVALFVWWLLFVGELDPANLVLGLVASSPATVVSRIPRARPSVRDGAAARALRAVSTVPIRIVADSASWLSRSGAE